MVRNLPSRKRNKLIRFFWKLFGKKRQVPKTVKPHDQTVIDMRDCMEQLARELLMHINQNEFDVDAMIAMRNIAAGVPMPNDYKVIALRHKKYAPQF